MAATAPERARTTRVDLPIEGMTCGACAARIERGLNRLDGVASASVNLAAEQATVVGRDPEVTGPRRSPRRSPPSATPSAATPTPPTRPARRAPAWWPRPSSPGRSPRLAMFPALQYPGWAWLAAVLATPVVLWAGAGFHRPPSPGCATGPRPWTPWSPSAPWPPGVGRWRRCWAPAPATPPQGARRRPRVLRGRRHHREVWSVRPLAGESRPEPLRPGPAPPAGAGARARPWCCATAPRWRCRSRRWRWATGSWSGPARSWPPTGWSPRAAPRSTGRC